MRRLPNPTRALFARYPWSVVVLFLGLAAYIAVSLAREETRLPPRGSEAIVWRLVGLAAVAGLILLIRQLYDRGCLGLAAIVLAAGTLFAVGFRNGLGWTRSGNDVDPATLPPHLHAFGAGVVAGYAIVILGFGMLAARNIVTGNLPRQPVTDSGLSHRVSVYDTRPRATDDTRFEFDPYFIATCECGWTGEAHETREAALADAHSHSRNVDPDVKAPVG